MVGTPKPPLRIQRLRKREHRKRLGWGYPQSTGVEPRKIDPTVADDHPVPLEMSKVGTSEQPHGHHPLGVASGLPPYQGPGAACVLLRRLSGWVFTSRGHNPLDSQIGHHVPIVLISMRRIEREHRELRYVEVHEFHHCLLYRSCCRMPCCSTPLHP